MKAFQTSVRCRGPCAVAKASNQLTDPPLNYTFRDAADLRDQNIPMSARTLQEPLLGSSTAGDSNSTHVVTCNGVKGTLTIFKDGGVSFKPLEVRPLNLYATPRDLHCAVSLQGTAFSLGLRMCTLPCCRRKVCYGAACVGGKTWSQRYAE